MAWHDETRGGARAHSWRPLTYLICFIRFVNCMRADHTWRSLAPIISPLCANGATARRSGASESLEEGGRSNMATKIWPRACARAHSRSYSAGAPGWAPRSDFSLSPSLPVALSKIMNIARSSRFSSLSHMSRNVTQLFFLPPRGRVSSAHLHKNGSFDRARRLGIVRSHFGDHGKMQCSRRNAM